MSRLNANNSAITDCVGVSPVAKLDGGVPSMWEFPELGTETFDKGEMVCLSGSPGANAVGITKPGTDASGYGILGFAADDAGGTTSTFTGVWLATPDTVFRGNIGESNTSANAVTAAVDIGHSYGLTSLSGRTYVDKYKTSAFTVMCRVIGLDDTDDLGCYYGKVYFTVVQHKCQLYNFRSSGVLDPVIV